MNINGPEGTNLAVMNDGDAGDREEILATPGVRLVLVERGRIVSRRSQSGRMLTCASRRMKSEPFPRPHLDRTEKGKPLNAFRGNYTQQDVMTEVRKRLQKYCAACVPACATRNL